MKNLEKEIQKLKQVISQHKTSKIIKDGKSKNKSLVNLGSSNFIKTGNSLTRVSVSDAKSRITKSLKRRTSKRIALKKYCEFYRFGKCRKKCRYIHDPSRISPCPRYLQGLDCNNCKLNHVLTPFITPNCKFFLIGNCTKKGCRFLHLKKDNGKICPDFADNGYCSLGGSCSNLHVFSCPRFEKDGKCTKKGCKLKHSLPLMGDQEMPIMPDFTLESSEEVDSEKGSEDGEDQDSELEIFQD
jgi:hypothetical protein